ncbi:CPBP family intramembrane glutamic endopeptidase [Oceanobacillus polygoni]|uniref:Membrane protease YdiL (CAAX protease family) n=1 Tax=Oceanobacillus polygoni TaxID=1235259 RepID=A0A9X1CCB1_9BACI|nr:CPBP family intramembrane glutamic endopeptidase [Oceanobacillus polygoni]MBP2077831.1 membrane protease YdiL (CAAX protease family) [Oceanobacillus polygoni]
MKQTELIKQLSDAELKKQLFLSQGIFLLISIGLSFFLFDSFSNWILYFNWNFHELLMYGVVVGLIIVIIDIFIMWVFPKKYVDDGGINERIFQNQSIPFIFILSLVVAISEELLFRGVIQTEFGYFIASTVFALVHFRYLKKPVLFISVVGISFWIGYLFEITGNLLVTITTHFIVDFLLGLVIRFKK